MKCECCHKSRGMWKLGDLKVCKKCYLDIMSAFTYHIGGKEVTEEEYRKAIEEGKV